MPVPASRPINKKWDVEGEIIVVRQQKGTLLAAAPIQ
jgi:hypothetical protein